ncbi:hypothetical protein [Cellulomonas composti]|uniref:Uncharacterized protein n=1 Tax=Cellulomonas composti TaxID=266130 RepID=A0A511JCZ9_9CELL|nr:hypothetical protein [Cellulomonas composti]GEL95852.1 hypothetical protein CCO02nite_25100 [Cellulomonas composti]
MQSEQFVRDYQFPEQSLRNYRLVSQALELRLAREEARSRYPSSAVRVVHHTSHLRLPHRRRSS